MPNVICNLCPFQCDIPEGKAGKCKVRGNVDGDVKLLTYGLVTTAEVGPIEQKPLYHFHPGMKVLSIGGSGCNMFCAYCQNYDISQVKRDKDRSTPLSPEDVVKMALDNGAKAVAFTYSEPVVWYEYVVDVAKAARKAGLKAILKTNAWCNPRLFERLCVLMDAVNIDFKGNERLYKEVCGMDIPDLYQSVIYDNTRFALKTCHLELSTLAIPGYMGKEETKNFLYCMASASAPSCPVHILKFIPDFKMLGTQPPSAAELEDYRSEARKYFQHVYINFAMIPADTICYCGQVLVERIGLKMEINNLVDGNHCPRCHQEQGFVA